MSCRRIRKTALNRSHAENGRWIDVLIDRRWGRKAGAGLSRARPARVKAAHCVVTLAQIAVAPVDSVVSEAHIRRQRLRRSVPTATC